MAKPLKIAWDNVWTGENRAGSGVYASQLVAHLSGHPDLDVEVFDGFRRASRLKGLQRLFWYHWQFPRSLRGRHFDLFHGPAFFVPFDCPCPAIATVLDLTPFLFPQHFAGLGRIHFRVGVPYALRTASAIICISEHSKTDLLRLHGVPSSKVHVVYPGVDHERFRPTASLDARWAGEMGIKADYVLHVGTLFHRKNIPTLLRAIAHLRSMGQWGASRQLVLAGSEIPGLLGAQEIYQTVRDLDLSEEVLFAGHVPSEHLPGLYASAKVLVMPSLYEGFGFPIVEAMAAGTPVIASNVSSLPEVAGDAALKFEPADVLGLADALRVLLQNQSTWDELRRKGLARSNLFTWPRTAEDTVRVYRTVVPR